MPTMSLDLPADLDAELRATANRTGVPMARIVRDGVRLRLDRLNRPPLTGAPIEPGASVEWTDTCQSAIRANVVAELRRYAEHHEARGNPAVSSRVRECLDVLPSEWEHKSFTGVRR